MNFGEDDYYKVELPRELGFTVFRYHRYESKVCGREQRGVERGTSMASRPRRRSLRNATRKPWSGGIASVQFNWLKKQVDLAEKEGKKVIVCSHNALAPGSAREGMVAWNADALVVILNPSRKR